MTYLGIDFLPKMRRYAILFPAKLCLLWYNLARSEPNAMTLFCVHVLVFDQPKIHFRKFGWSCWKYGNLNVSRFFGNYANFFIVIQLPFLNSYFSSLYAAFWLALYPMFSSSFSFCLLLYKSHKNTRLKLAKSE